MARMAIGCCRSRFRSQHSSPTCTGTRTSKTNREIAGFASWLALRSATILDRAHRCLSHVCQPRLSGTPMRTSQPEPSPEALRVLRLLEQHGMLLVQDAKLPNLVGEVVGRTVEGSWWGHPAKHDIFRILNEVADHPDTFIAKLLNKKQTLVHRALF